MKYKFQDVVVIQQKGFYEGARGIVVEYDGDDIYFVSLSPERNDIPFHEKELSPAPVWVPEKLTN